MISEPIIRAKWQLAQTRFLKEWLLRPRDREDNNAWPAAWLIPGDQQQIAIGI
jgi:hypothetical protein